MTEDYGIAARSMIRCCLNIYFISFLHSDLFKADLSPEMYWRGPSRSQEMTGGGRGVWGGGGVLRGRGSYI